MLDGAAHPFVQKKEWWWGEHSGALGSRLGWLVLQLWPVGPPNTESEQHVVPSSVQQRRYSLRSQENVVLGSVTEKYCFGYMQ